MIVLLVVSWLFFSWEYLQTVETCKNGSSVLKNGTECNFEKVNWVLALYLGLDFKSSDDTIYNLFDWQKMPFEVLKPDGLGEKKLNMLL